MAELLPCPFCGSKAELVHPHEDMYIVGCSNEDCPIWCGLAFNMEEHAVKFWNARALKERGVKQMMEFLDEVIEAMRDLFVSALLLIAMTVTIITMPLWIIPYAIYKAKERGGEK